MAMAIQRRITMSKNRKQRKANRQSKLSHITYCKWKNSPKHSARIKHMLFSISKPCDDEFWPYPDLPWYPHPFAYQGIPTSILQRDERILRKIRKLIGDKAFNDLHTYMIECGYGGDLEITFDRSGTEQDEDWGFVQKAYIDQSCGYLGDDYSGYVWIPITAKRYLRFYFTL